jgi:uncharacterized protein (DUF4415 family)
MPMKKYGTPDAENPEFTAADLRKARPAHEVLPEVFGKDGRLLPKYRGKQKAPTKQLVTLRLSRATLDAYRQTGRGWQTRISDTLDRTVRQLPKPKRAKRSRVSRSTRTAST